jgi:hypothetical protein
MAHNLLRAAGTRAGSRYAKPAPPPSAATSSRCPPGPPAAAAATSPSTCPKATTGAIQAWLNL